ncbi:MAG: hypothetical protein JWQ98_1094 [Chlorobi bacterium]|nr:hypothetical protein [Chlorobiota bacterium]
MRFLIVNHACGLVQASATISETNALPSVLPRKSRYISCFNDQLRSTGISDVVNGNEGPHDRFSARKRFGWTSAMHQQVIHGAYASGTNITFVGTALQACYRIYLFHLNIVDPTDVQFISGTVCSRVDCYERWTVFVVDCRAYFVCERRISRQRFSAFSN